MFSALGRQSDGDRPSRQGNPCATAPVYPSALPACQLSENKEPTHERLGNHLQQGRSHRASSPAVPHKPSPEEVAEHLLEWAEANLKPGHYSTGKLESDEPAELLLRRFGIVVTGIAEA